MTLKDLVEQVAAPPRRKLKHSKGNRQKTLAVLRRAFDAIATAVAAGERIAIPKFGVFALGHRKARRIRNPQTNEIIKLAAREQLVFRASKHQKRRAPGGGK